MSSRPLRDRTIHKGRILGGTLTLVLALAACDGGDGGDDASLPPPAEEGAVAAINAGPAPEPAPPAADAAAPPPEFVPCVRGIDGAIRMLSGIDDGEARAQLYLDTAVAALETGDFYACLVAVGDALQIIKEAQEVGG